MKEAKQLAMKLGEKNGLLYVNGYDHPHIMAGQGTIGLEIAEQVNDADALIVPVGGGGLIAGIGTAIKTLCPNTKIIVRRVIYLTILLLDTLFTFFILNFNLFLVVRSNWFMFHLKFGVFAFNLKSFILY